MEEKKKIVFMGTPYFAEIVLSALVEAGHSVVAAYTQPDKPTGRDQEVAQCPVKVLAESHNIPVEQPSALNDDAIKTFRSYDADIVIVAAYGKILPESMLKIPEFGFVNIHASLLPRWRGASPIQNALLAGDMETGVTLMQIEKGTDTGPLLAARSLPILPEDNLDTLTAKLAREGASLLLETLPNIFKKTIEPKPQDHEQATVCQLIEREDGKIFWNEEAETIYNRYRALSPWPGIFSFWKRENSLLRIKFHRISIQKKNPETKYPLGQVFEIGEHIGVQTGNGIVFLEEVQLEGKNRTSMREFLQGYPDFVGAMLE